MFDKHMILEPRKSDVLGPQNQQLGLDWGRFRGSAFPLKPRSGRGFSLAYAAPTGIVPQEPDWEGKISDAI